MVNYFQYIWVKGRLQSLVLVEGARHAVTKRHLSFTVSSQLSTTLGWGGGYAVQAARIPPAFLPGQVDWHKCYRPTSKALIILNWAKADFTVGGELYLYSACFQWFRVSLCPSVSVNCILMVYIQAEQCQPIARDATRYICVQ